MGLEPLAPSGHPPVSRTYYTLQSFSAPLSRRSTSTSVRSRPIAAVPFRIWSIISPPRILPTAVAGLRALYVPIIFPVSSPFAIFDPKTALLRVELGSKDPDSGGATVNSARSWISVSLIRVVISWGCRSALVNILGGGKLDKLSVLGWHWDSRVSRQLCNCFRR